MRQIKLLEKAKYKDFIVPIGYTTEEYYDVTVDKTADGFSVDLKKRRFAEPVTHMPEEYDFPDKLYQEHWDGAEAFGMFDDEELIGIIEIWKEEWSNRLRITELWVCEKHQKTGAGKALINLAKEQMKEKKCRAVMLETQSCNVNAVDFYMHEGFFLIGFDSCCYANNDLERKEVRLEFGYLGENENI